MKTRKIDTDRFFSTYVVGDIPENWDNYAACITNVEVAPSDSNEGDYCCMMKVYAKFGCTLKHVTKVYNNILTTGRNRFQELIEDFELYETDDNGAEYLDLTKLNNKLCIAKVNSAKLFKKIVNIELDGSETEKKIAKFFEDNIKDAHLINMESVPPVVKYYCFIPTTTPADEYIPDFEYHGCIRDIECEENDNDINVKIAAYVFNTADEPLKEFRNAIQAYYLNA